MLKLTTLNSRTMLNAGAWGAVLGLIGGKILGPVFSSFGGRFLNKLAPQTLVRLLWGLFAANAAATGWGVYSASSPGQRIFRGSLGLVGLMGNGLAIRKVTQWVKELNKVDTLLLAATESSGRIGGVNISGSNTVRVNIHGGALPQHALGPNLVEDHLDLPLPDETFKNIVGSRVQLAKNHTDVRRALQAGEEGAQAFDEWYRLLEQNGKLEISIANGMQSPNDITNALQTAGFRNVEYMSPGQTGSAWFRAFK